MKKIYTGIILAILPFLSSCKMVSFHEYRHEPTNKIKQCLWETGYKKDKCLKGKDLVLIPDFRTFSPSFQKPDSYLIVCSKNKNPFWISKAILRVPGEKGSETVLNLSKEFPFDKNIGETEYVISWILLFDSKNTDYSKYRMKENLEFEIEYSTNKTEPAKTEVFEIKLIEKRDVAWPT